jgi:hypothetical protein
MTNLLTLPTHFCFSVRFNLTKESSAYVYRYERGPFCVYFEIYGQGKNSLMSENVPET